MNIKGLYPYENHSLKDMQGEIWKEIPGYEGSYMISNKGRVKSLARKLYSLQGIKYRSTDLILSQKKQYTKGKVRCLQFEVSQDYQKRTFMTSRMVYSIFIKRLPDIKKKHLYVMHKDNDPLNNMAENLYIITPSELTKKLIASGLKKVSYYNFSQQSKDRFRMSALKPVSQYTLEGKYIKTYISREEAFKLTGINSTSIGKAVLGERLHAGGFIWKNGNDPSDVPSVQLTIAKRPLSCYTKKGKYVAGYKNIQEAEKLTKINRGSIRSCLQGKGHTAGGFIWKEGSAPQKIETADLVFNTFKVISQFDLQGNRLKIFSSIKEAAQKTGLSESGIRKAIKSNTNHAKGFIWLEGKQPKKITPPKQKIRAVNQYDLSGNFLAKYPSITVAAKLVNASHCSVSDAVLGNIKTCRGFIWKYAD
ncbi:NUMOD1 domain-containing DNA-binding protein [Apibacter raozihei]|uniref:NUMOD1 domain-containing DNA-binding protein n=1 Tax=Apibacter raozihei TaxID=2500547 RepID=UPI000FE4291E|nr:NUMOD1 domain-containing DNA-binding protein [Apibacter raozihei]